MFLKRLGLFFLDILEVVVFAVAIFLFVYLLVMQPHKIKGASMEPNFPDGEYLLTDKITYRFREPQRGEVVVFHSPSDESTYFIKRIIGLPGETVTIKNGAITIANEANKKGFKLEESYIPQNVATRGDESFVLGPNGYLLLGDNRSYSFDSRSWGALEKDKIVGLVRLRLWPITELTAFAAPTY